MNVRRTLRQVSLDVEGPPRQFKIWLHLLRVFLCGVFNIFLNSSLVISDLLRVLSYTVGGERESVGPIGDTEKEGNGAVEAWLLIVEVCWWSDEKSLRDMNGNLVDGGKGV